MKRRPCYLLVGLAVAMAGSLSFTPDARANSVKTGRSSAVVHTPASRYPLRGSRSAPLNVIYWAGFKNDATKQVQAHLQKMLTKWRGKLRIQFMNKYRDGSYYKPEQYAAAVAREAFDQGGDRLFWKLHDELLKLPTLYSQTNATIDRAARAVGVNMSRLGRAISSGKHDKAIAAERDLAVRFGVPSYNSSVVLLVGQELMYISRWTQFYYIEAVVKRNLKVAQDLQRKGLASGQVHQQMIAQAKKTYRRWQSYSYRYRYRRRTPTPRASKRYNIPVGHSPSLGPKSAWVTVVAFVDFTNYTCHSAWNYLKGVQKRYKNRMRLVYKAFPRRYYSYALGAARAAYAAHAQGKFWKLSDILFQNRYRLYPSQLPAYAKQAGLDVPRFTRDARSPQMSQRVLQDMQLARKVGVTYAPTVYINGRRQGRYWNQYVFAEALKKELKGGLLSRILGE